MTYRENNYLMVDNPEKEDYIIQTYELTKRFGEEVAVNDVTFNVPRGKIFGFIGPSGSGKTTTIRMLTGYYQPTSGQARVFNRPPTQFDQEVKGRIGYMPQFFVLYPNLSVWENLNFAASMYGMSLRRKDRLLEVLDFVELTEHRKKIVRNISGGMQRRLSLAATLLHDPDLIFLDEPTAGVDPVLRRKFWDQFRNLQEQGRTLFVTTQYVSEAAYCDLVGVMGKGVLLQVDTPEGLRYSAFGGDIVDLRTQEPVSYGTFRDMAQLPFVRELVSADTRSARLVVDEASRDIAQLINWSQEHNVPIETVEEYQPPFDDVFVELVENGGNK